MEALDVAVAAALGHEPPAGPKRRVEAMKQGVVVADQWKTAFENAASTGSSRISSARSACSTVARGGCARALDHGRRRVDGDHVCPREPLEQQARDAAAATPASGTSRRRGGAGGSSTARATAAVRRRGS